MKTGKLAYKLFLTLIVIIIVEFIFSLMILSWDNEIFQWIMGILFIVVFWFFIYSDMSTKGQSDTKMGAFRPLKGFIAGLIASIPNFTIYIIAILYKPQLQEMAFDWTNTVLRVLLIPYIKLYLTFENLLPDYAIVLFLLFPIVTGVSYYDGKRRRNKILEKIDEAESKRIEKSKSDFFKNK